MTIAVYPKATRQYEGSNSKTNTQEKNNQTKNGCSLLYVLWQDEIV